jgi:phosphoglucosamine mutase
VESPADTSSMKKLFGTDGMRGEAGVFPLDAATVRTVGASLALHLHENVGRAPVIVVGRDTRESGDWLEEALFEGAISAGANCQSAGVITTPGVAFLARTLPADAGVVISASHNEYKDNGIKIFAPSGRKIEEQTESLIERDIHAPAGVQPHRSQSQEDIRSKAAALQERYLDYLAREIGRGLSLGGLSVVIDCANGAASNLAPQLFEGLGARLIAINNNPDGQNINRDCGSLHIQRLQDAVLAEDADLGVAFDGDADRSLFVDAQGRFIDGDATLWAMAKHLQANGELAKSLVVATVMSNIGLEIALRSRGLRLVRTDVGDKHVLDELLRSEASLGGEQSGHIIFPKLSLAGDGMITTLCLLRAMKERGNSLAELTEGLEHYPQILVNVRVREKRPFSDIPSLQNLITLTESKLGDSGRLLLRYSGTEALARVMIEGQSQSQIEQYAGEIAGVIRQTIGVD